MAAKDINSWNTMIEGYLKNCFPNKALKMFAAMLKELKPDSRTMACILPACAGLLLRDYKLMTSGLEGHSLPTVCKERMEEIVFHHLQPMNKQVSPISIHLH
ncbi:hypothetical protein V6N13_052450 [Hibiscus sabdariffa]